MTQEPTIGELARTCDRIETTLTEMRSEAKAERIAIVGRLDAHSYQLTIHEEQLKSHLKSVAAWKAWLGGVLGGSIVAAVEWFRK